MSDIPEYRTGDLPPPNFDPPSEEDPMFHQLVDTSDSSKPTDEDGEQPPEADPPPPFSSDPQDA